MRRVVPVAMASLMGGITHAAMGRKLGSFPDASPPRRPLSWECWQSAVEGRQRR
jgi:hypothetical protein